MTTKNNFLKHIIYDVLRLPAHVTIAVKLYMLLIVIYTLFRMALLVVCMPKIGDASIADVLTAFVVGLRFDCVVIGFAIALPVILLTIMSFVGSPSGKTNKAIATLCTIIFAPTFAVCAVDIPYFNQFFIHFNVAAFDGMEGNIGLVAKMILEEPRFWIMIIPIVLVPIVFYKIVYKLLQREQAYRKKMYVSKSIYTVVLFFVMFAGMRGNLNFKARPIHTGMAYFGNNQLLNQLGLNPVFIFLNSFVTDESDAEIQMMDSRQALAQMQQLLDIVKSDTVYPLQREVCFDQEKIPYNIVLILMESMSADNLLHHGCTKGLTPFLDSLLKHSLYFENCYTMGNRTCSGMYSTTTSYPTLFDKQPMYGTTIKLFNSMPYELKKHGYSTTFFLSHDKNFDNSNGFLLANGYDRVYSQEDYPAHEIKNTWGVCDKFLFTFALDKINKLSNNANPFFATILTISNHPPYYFDPDFEFKNTRDEDRIVEYADDMLRYFFDKAAQEPWFDSTLFVLVADHGTAQDATYPLPLSYFRTPLIFYAPNIIAPKIDSGMANQIDVFPTTMGLLNIPYTANHFGIDLTRQQRKYACIMNVSGYAVLDNEWMLFSKKDSDDKRLYRYKNKDVANYIDNNQQQATDMDNYGKALWQTTQLLLNNRATRIQSN